MFITAAAAAPGHCGQIDIVHEGAGQNILQPIYPSIQIMKQKHPHSPPCLLSPPTHTRARPPFSVSPAAQLLLFVAIPLNEVEVFIVIVRELGSTNIICTTI